MPFPGGMSLTVRACIDRPAQSDLGSDEELVLLQVECHGFSGVGLKLYCMSAVPAAASTIAKARSRLIMIAGHFGNNEGGSKFLHHPGFECNGHSEPVVFERPANFLFLRRMNIQSGD